MKLTLSLIKADVGSIGGHTRPSEEMLKIIKKRIKKAKEDKFIIDGFISYTGDDIAILMSHQHGENNPEIHKFAWDSFMAATEVAREEGLYGAGQDLLTTAPSANIKGAGPAVAEMEIEYGTEIRPAEVFLMFAADKCGPGAYNLPMFLSFADPMYCSGLMLSSMIEGFTFKVIDMDNTKGESFIKLNTPEDYYNLTFLLRDNERFGISEIFSRKYNQKAAAISTQRMHNIAGKYVGKDDPIALVRAQGIFPAPEEIVSPYTLAHYVGGGARGSHVMPLMPVAINTDVTGPYCLPLISCLGFSINQKGEFSEQFVDFFANKVWDSTRLKAQQKGEEIRRQGWSGPAMLQYSELEYGGFKITMKKLLEKFKLS